jgi:hypothetical protein
MRTREYYRNPGIVPIKSSNDLRQERVGLQRDQLRFNIAYISILVASSAIAPVPVVIVFGGIGLFIGNAMAQWGKHQLDSQIKERELADNPITSI